MRENAQMIKKLIYSVKSATVVNSGQDDVLVIRKSRDRSQLASRWYYVKWFGQKAILYILYFTYSYILYTHNFVQLTLTYNWFLYRKKIWTDQVPFWRTAPTISPLIIDLFHYDWTNVIIITTTYVPVFSIELMCSIHELMYLIDVIIT